MTYKNDFIKALSICISLEQDYGRPTQKVFECLDFLYSPKGSKQELDLLKVEFQEEVLKCLEVISEYKGTVDNWRIDCSLGFGLRQQCDFLLELLSSTFPCITGNNNGKGNIVWWSILCNWRPIAFFGSDTYGLLKD